MITATVETITPAKAATMLEGNTHNRTLSQRKVDEYAAAMKRGEWQLNGENIKTTGKLILDGQHRLWACIVANKSFKTFVIRGLPQKTQSTIDTGWVRTNTHHLVMNGEKYAATLASAIALVIKYDCKGLNKRLSISHIQTMKFLNKHPEIRDIAQRYGSKSFLGTKSLLTATHFIFARNSAVDADTFMESYCDGTGLDKGSPVLALRNRMIKDLSSEAKLHTIQKFALFIKAWNLYREGKSSSRLQYRSMGDRKEEFPVAK